MKKPKSSGKLGQISIKPDPKKTRVRSKVVVPSNINRPNGQSTRPIVATEDLRSKLKKKHPLNQLWEEYEREKTDNSELKNWPKLSRVINNVACTPVASHIVVPIIDGPRITENYIKSLGKIGKNKKKKLYRKMEKQKQLESKHESNAKFIEELHQKYAR